MSLYKKIAITTGDQNGIGFEVCVKALNKLVAVSQKNKIIFFIFRHKSQKKFSAAAF